MGLAMLMAPASASTGLLIATSQSAPAIPGVLDAIPIRRANATYEMLQFHPPSWEMLDRILFDDSLGWVANVYVSGSLNNVSLLSGSYSSGNWSARGYYRFSNRIFGGRYSGSVIFRFYDGALSCLEYHDMGGECRPQHRR